MLLKLNPTPILQSEGPFVSVVDLGTACIKALVCEMRQGQVAVLGVGRESLGERTALAATGEYATPPELLASLCDLALRHAEDMTLTLWGRRVVPDQVVLGVGADVLCSFPTTVTVRRSRPAERITEAELTSLLRRAGRLAWRELPEYHRVGEGTSPEAWALLNAMVTEVRVDGVRVADPQRLQGESLEITVFNVFAPAAYRKSLSSLAADLELDLKHLIAEPLAVARCMPVSDAIFLDLGADRTNVALVRQGSLAAMSSLLQGGRTFTRLIGKRLGLAVEQAEEVKLHRSLGVKGPAASRSALQAASGRGARPQAGSLPHPRSGLGTAGKTQDPLADAVNRCLAMWLKGLEQVLGSMAAQGPLPPRILLCGGASQMPEVMTALSSPGWARRLRFAALPEVTFLSPREVRGVTDRSQRLLSPQDVPVMGLARQAAILDHPETPQERLVQQMARTYSTLRRKEASARP